MTRRLLVLYVRRRLCDRDAGDLGAQNFGYRVVVLIDAFAFVPTRVHCGICNCVFMLALRSVTALILNSGETVVAKLW